MFLTLIHQLLLKYKSIYFDHMLMSSTSRPSHFRPLVSRNTDLLNYPNDIRMRVLVQTCLLNWNFQPYQSCVPIISSPKHETEQKIINVPMSSSSASGTHNDPVSGSMFHFTNPQQQVTTNKQILSFSHFLRHLYSRGKPYTLRLG